MADIGVLTASTSPVYDVGRIHGADIAASDRDPDEAAPELVEFDLFARARANVFLKSPLIGRTPPSVALPPGATL